MIYRDAFMTCHMSHFCWLPQQLTLPVQVVVNVKPYFPIRCFEIPLWLWY